MRYFTAEPIPHLATIRLIDPFAYRMSMPFCTAARSGSFLRMAIPIGNGLIGWQQTWTLVGFCFAYYAAGGASA